MKFEPLDEPTKDTSKLSPGLANFQVLNATEKVSKKGNDMIEIVCQITDSYGVTGHIYDYLVSNIKWKLKQFLISINAESLAKNLEILPQDILLKSGVCKIEVSPGDGRFPDKMIIKDYLPYGAEVITKEKPKNDDVPF